MTHADDCVHVLGMQGKADDAGRWIQAGGAGPSGLQHSLSDREAQHRASQERAEAWQEAGGCLPQLHAWTAAMCSDCRTLA